MSPAHVIEPTYEAIKRRLMNVEWAGCARLDSTLIAEARSVSVTPVRDSLYRLTGERMVDFTHGESFHVHRLTETALRDMLEFNLILLLAAIATARAQRSEEHTSEIQSLMPNSYAVFTSTQKNTQLLHQHNIPPSPCRH